MGPLHALRLLSPVGPLAPLVAGDRSMRQCVTGGWLRVLRAWLQSASCGYGRELVTQSRGSSRVTVALKAVCLQEQVLSVCDLVSSDADPSVCV